MWEGGRYSCQPAQQGSPTKVTSLELLQQLPVIGTKQAIYTFTPLHKSVQETGLALLVSHSVFCPWWISSITQKKFSYIINLQSCILQYCNLQSINLYAYGQESCLVLSAWLQKHLTLRVSCSCITIKPTGLFHTGQGIPSAPSP